jgi:hypothetical protein
MTEIRSKQLNLDAALTLPNGTTATTQSLGDNTTKLATDAFVIAHAATGDFFQRNGTIISPVTPNDDLYMGIGTVGAYEFIASPLVGATYFATFATSINGDYGFGSLVTTATGGAAIVGGYLDLTHSDVRYVDIEAPGNADFTQTGTIKWILNPNYHDAPNSSQYLIDLYESAANDKNRIYLYHSGSNAALGYYVYDSAGTLIHAASLGDWFPTASTDYEFELTTNSTTGLHELRINGNLFGSMSGTGTRTGTCTKLRIGSDKGGTYTSDFKIKNLVVFNNIQHIANYTPGYTLTTAFAQINNTASKLVTSLSVVDSAGTEQVYLTTNGTSKFCGTTQNNARLYVGYPSAIGVISAASVLTSSASVGTELYALTLHNSTSGANRPVSLNFIHNQYVTGTELIFGKISVNNTTTTQGAEYGETIFSNIYNGALTEMGRFNNLKSWKLAGSQTYTSSVTLTHAAYTAVDVKGVRTVICDCTSGDIVIQGFANGVTGQEILVHKVTAGGAMYFFHLDAAGTQKIVTTTGANRNYSAYGGAILRYDGYWYEIA